MTESAARARLADLGEILRAVPDGITVQDAGGRLVYANDAAARMIGFPDAESLLATPVEEVMERFELLDEERRPLAVEELPGRLVLAGEEEAERLVCYRERPTGEERWSLVRATALTGGLAVNVFQDVTERKRLEDRFRFLADADVVLASSLDYETTLATVAALAVPRLADWCIVYMVEADGSIRRLALEHSGGRADEVARVLERHPLDPEAREGVPEVIRTGLPDLRPEMTHENLVRDTEGADELAEELADLVVTSYLCVPLTARGRTLGAISLLMGESGRRFGEGELELAEDLARGAALAVDNALLFRQADQRSEQLRRLSAVALAAPAAPVDELLALVTEEARRIVGTRYAATRFGEGREAVSGSSEPEDDVLETPLLGRDGEPLGFIRLAGKVDGGFDAADEAILVQLGQLVSAAGENTRLHEETRRSLALLDAILASSPVAIGFWDRDLRYVQVNEALATLNGIPPEAHVGRTLRDVVPDLADLLEPIYRGVIDTGEPFVQEESTEMLAPRLGEDRHWLSSYYPVRTLDGEVIGLGAVIMEITERKRAEAQRDEAQQALAARAKAAQALEFVGDGIVLVDRDGVVRLWNPVAASVTGLSAADVEGRRVDEVVPGWDELVARVPIVPSERGHVARSETLPLEVDGRELWLSVSGVDFGEGTVFAFRDVTEERGLEQLKSDFVSTVSHELRTPLAAIYGAALTLRRPDMPLLDEQRQELLGVIADEADRLARIINDILWTSRIESGGLQVQIESCNAAELTGTVVQAALLHRPVGVAIELDAPSDLPRVAADPDKVRQVLSNLLDNAVKYSPDGGRIAVQLTVQRGRMRFLVSDEGLGIPPGERERVFEKFYRLDPDLNRGVGGTGLGLYICRELVRRMGGWIWVEPNAPRGSTVVVELPLVA